MIIEDHVYILMPSSRELLFPAFAMLQHFINGVEYKLRSTLMVPQDMPFECHLHYELDLPAGEWEFFRSIGLELKQQPEKIDTIDMLLDFREGTLAKFTPTDKHAAQIMGAMSGIQGLHLPVIRKAKLRAPDFKWIVLGEDQPSFDLTKVQDGGITGVIAYASWETYLAASMGLAVIELQPATRDRNWLKKWASPIYRCVDADTGSIEVQVTAAKQSLEYHIRLALAQRANVQHQ